MSACSRTTYTAIAAPATHCPVLRKYAMANFNIICSEVHGEVLLAICRRQGLSGACHFVFRNSQEPEVLVL